MSRDDSIYQQLRSHLTYLNLAAAAEALPAQLEVARATKIGHTEFMEQLLRIEVQATEQRRWQGRMRFANFPAPWRIEDFDFGAQPGIDEALIRELATCNYLDDATNVLFIGPPGVGKTMLAIALGHAAVDTGLRVYYCTAADLAARCRKAALEGRWEPTMRFFNGPSVLIIDELGCAPRGADGSCGLRDPPLVVAAAS
jgi:DNA replication protein DnaC